MSCVYSKAKTNGNGWPYFDYKLAAFLHKALLLPQITTIASFLMCSASFFFIFLGP